MSVSIRLSRQGKRGKPSYRLVAIPKENKRDGKVLEILGWYDPTSNPSKLEFNKDRLKFWLSQGALPSQSVQKLLHL